MTKQFRPGSMGAADQKSKRIFCWVATGIVAIIFLMFYANLFNTYAFDYFKRAGWPKYFGVIAFAGCIYWLWKAADFSWGERGAKNYGLGALLLLLLGIALASGFNWDLHGIETGA